MHCGVSVSELYGAIQCLIAIFSLSVLLVFSLGQQWLHESTCNVEILHHAQMGQDVYIYGIRTYHIYINI